MNRGMAGVTALAVLALAACGGLPEQLKLQVAAEQREFAASRKDFEKARDDVKAKLAQEPELAKIRGLLWQPALDRDTEKFNEAASELKRLEDLRRQDRQDSRDAVERLLAGERRIRTAAVDDARAMQSEAQRFTTLKANLSHYDRDAEQLNATGLDTVAVVVRKAETDWPAKKTDLEQRLSEVKSAEAKAVQDWKTARKAGGAHPDYASLFAAEEELQAEKEAFPKQVQTLKDLSGQLYTSWDKLLVDLSDHHDEYKEKVRTVRTRYTDVAAQKSDVTSDETWVNISKPLYAALEKNLGMTIEHKAAGKYDSEVEKTPQPPGYAYIAPPSEGRNQYGYWNNSGGMSVWTWLPQYLIMRDLLYRNSYQPIPSYDYNQYRSAQSSGQSYYGRDVDGAPKYGSHGTFTQRHYASSQYVQKNGGFGSSSYSSRPGASSSEHRYSGSSSDPAGHRFGSGGSSGRTFGSRPAGRSFGSGGRSFGGGRRR